MRKGPLQMMKGRAVGWLTVVGIASLLLLSLVACGNGEDTGIANGPAAETPTRVPETSPTPENPAPATPTPAPVNTPTATPLPPEPEPGETVELEITADNMRFDRDTLGPVPAGARVLLTFQNEEGLPHNVAIYENGMSTALFSGEVFGGPETMVYEFVAPEEPGEYVFVCEPHMVQMRGTFVVEAAEGQL